MWFNNLMDDLRKAFLVSNEYRGIFVPIFLKLAMNIVVGIVIVVGVITSIAAGSFAGIAGANPIEVAIGIIGPTALFILTGYVLYIVLYSLIEVGSINLYKVALSGQKPVKADFTDVIKSYIGKVISGKLLIHFLVVILSPIIIILYLIYVVLIGTLTGGWALILLSVIIDMYFATWTIAIVNDGLGVSSAIGKSFRFAKAHHKAMFILILSLVMVTQYAVTIFGPLGAVFLGWFIGGVLRTYFKMGVYITYLRYENVSYEVEGK
ncbi:MAG: hypothetical protein WBA54_03845 [Acidaminobacteraceae bacterium]